MTNQHNSSLPVRRRRKTVTNQEQGQNNSSSREASAESNDETETDTASLSTNSIHSPTTTTSTGTTSTNLNPIKQHIKRHQILSTSSNSKSNTTSTNIPDHENSSAILLDNEDDETSEGHDGDISSATAPSTRSPHNHHHTHQILSSSNIINPISTTTYHHQQNNSSSSSSIAQLESEPDLNSPASTSSFNTSPILIRSKENNKSSNPMISTSIPMSNNNSINYEDRNESIPPSPHNSPKAVAASRYPAHGGEEASPAAWQSAPTGFLSNLTAEDIQDHIKIAIAGDPDARTYNIKSPPQGRPVRIYADGVYDLLHYGHMLQLRQCKLAFPSVHLMVGVCSSELVKKYKAPPVLTSLERYESVRHCKWVDEVVEDAPWCVDEGFMKEHEIDYIAHDEEPYVSAGSDDVYAYAKSIGAFLPTKRTNGVSTSELLQRIVEGYREGEFDGKFIKLDRPDLCSTRAPSEAETNRSNKDTTTTTTTNTTHNNNGGLENSTTSLLSPVLSEKILSVSDEKMGVKEEEIGGGIKLTKEEETEELLRKLEVNA